MFNSLVAFYQNRKNTTRFKQVVLLYGVTFTGVPLGIVTSIILTRFLGPSAYGDYKFLYELFRFAFIIISIGLLQAGNRALVLNDDPEKAKEYYGAELVIMLALFMVMSVGLYIYAFYDNNVSEKGLQDILFYLIPFSWVFLLVRLFETLFQADNRIFLLSYSRLYPKVGFLIAIIPVYIFYKDFGGDRLALIWALFILTQIFVFIFIIFQIRPSFKNLRLRIKKIWKYNISYGFNVYLGSISAVGFAALTGVLISYFGSDNTGVGYFSLALTIVTPLSFIPNVLATTHYKDFSIQKQVHKRLINIALILSLSALVFIWIIVKPFIDIFYGSEFQPVISLTIVLSTGMICYGLGDFFNRFLGAHGQGKALRNSSFLVGFILLTLNILLIPKYGENGAAIAKALSGLIYVVIILIYYRLLVRKLNKNSL